MFIPSNFVLGEQYVEAHVFKTSSPKYHIISVDKWSNNRAGDGRFFLLFSCVCLTSGDGVEGG